MKNIEIFIGSPRITGNTSVLAAHLKNQLDKYLVSTNISYLYDYEIMPCKDCRGCKKVGLKCIVQDDMQALYQDLLDADIIVIGTPIYWFGPTAITKLFIDRLRPYYGSKELSGKKAALLLPAGSGAEDCDLTIEMFKRTFKALEIDYLGAVTSEAYDIGDAAKDQQALLKLNELARKITDSYFEN